MESWKKIGIIATIIIVLAFPVYLVRMAVQHNREAGAVVEEASFVGEEKCVECHKPENDLWKISDHAHAMAPATDSTVLGDFKNIDIKSQGFLNHFYKEDGKFMVHTRGPEGTPGDFRIAYTFGIGPLQQYLVPFEKGRFQCLPFAWDTLKSQWFNLHDTMYMGQHIQPDDWLYWTNNGQNWNGMCADCHSTNLQKNYDPVNHSFHTTWSEINVSCEACHGPGSKHLEWAALPEMARPADNNMGLLVKTSGISTDEYIMQCARCHTRRGVFGDFHDPWGEMLDYMDPQLLVEPYYHPDGQILEEDYVFASFTQSRMYMNDVKCNDCHDVHSGKIKYQDNELCLQCHRANEYDTYAHHFHKVKGEAGKPLTLANGKKVEVGEGALCVNCHMPGQYYMGVDFRRDHSIRIPRPDLTIQLGTPNACNQCHTDKTAQWSESNIKKWYGISRKPHYGTVMEAGRKGDAASLEPLIKMAQASVDLYTPVVKATAITLVSSFPGQKSLQALKTALNDPEPMIRLAAVRNYPMEDISTYLKDLQPLLHDPVKAIRMNAALKLSMVSDNQRDTTYNKAFQKALSEYRYSMEYMADFPSSMHNLGIMFANIGEMDKAEAAYEEALRIDNKFYPAKINLAMVYNRKGKNDQAEALFREVISNHPEMHEIFYSFGLLLAEEKKYDEALQYLEKAAKLMPSRSRIFYNLGLLYQFRGKQIKAGKYLQQALTLEPENPDFIYALADHYVKSNEPDKARPLAQIIKDKYPSSPIGQNLLDLINQMGK